MKKLASILMITGVMFLNACDLIGSAASGLSEYCSRTTTTVTTSADLRRGTCSEGDCSLYEAIERANLCGGTRFHTIELPSSLGTYEIASPDTSTSRAAGKGVNAFPAIRSFIIIEGISDSSSTLDHATIERVGATASNAFRFFYVAEGSGLTLRSISLQNGWANGEGGRNVGDDGGAIYNDGTAVLIDSSISGNRARGYRGGGALFNDGTLTVRNTNFEDNESDESGGAIANKGLVNYVGGDMVRNTAAVSGGALQNYNVGTVMLEKVAVADNSSERHGGAILNSGTLTVSKSSFLNNRTLVDYTGGAIYSDAIPERPVVISSSTFSGNTAHSGGAIFAGGQVTIIDSTIYRNSTLYRDRGVGAGVAGRAYNLTIKNTIIALNPGGDCEPGIFIATYGTANLDSDGSCDFTMTTDPMLGELALNGGSTENHMPPPGSAAIDAGTECWPTDQRDYARPSDGNGDGVVACDIGAVEVGGLPPGAGGGGVGDTDDSKDDDDKGGDQPGDPGTPPTVFITSHKGGEGYTADKFDKATGQWYYELDLTGEGDDTEDGALTGGSLVWTISPAVDGSTALGTGENVTAKLYGTTCEGDSYTITLTATDSDGNVVSTDIIIISYLFC